MAIRLNKQYLMPITSLIVIAMAAMAINILRVEVVDKNQLVKLLAGDISDSSLSVVEDYGQKLLVLTSAAAQKQLVDLLRDSEELSLSDRMPIGVRIQTLNIIGKHISLYLKIFPHLKREGYLFIINCDGEIKGHLRLFVADSAFENKFHNPSKSAD